MTRLIVALNRRITNQDLVWKTGVVLERNDTRAEAIEDYGRRKITVRVAGVDTRGLMAIVDEDLERIHESFPKLKYEKLLPCNCAECSGRDDAFAYTLTNLKRFALARKSIQCQKSMESVDPAALIRDLFPAVLQELERPLSEIGRGTDAVRKEVFASYSWAPESNAVVDQIEKALDGQGIRVLRDKSEMRYKSGIREFMQNVGRGKAIVVVLSKAYLESKSCMFELTEIAANGDLRSRVFPIVLQDANILDAGGRLGYAGYWEKKKKKLNSEMKKVSGENLRSVHDELDLFAKIRATIDGIVEILGDMNALTLEEHQASNFRELVQALEGR